MKHSITSLLLAVAIGTVASAQSFSYTVDADSVDTGEISNMTFGLPAVASIDSIEIDIATTWGSDQEITLTAPSGATYVPMFDSLDETGSGNFDLGLVAEDGSLANVDTYTFVETGGLTAYTDDFSPGGTYDALSWSTGAEVAGDWNMLIVDDAAGDPTSIGTVTVNYSVVPEPVGMTLLLSGLVALLGLRRR